MTFNLNFCRGMLNVHASLLPRWRGAAPIIYALKSGDEITGVTIMKIKPDKFDTGEILLQKDVKINDKMRQIELHKLLSECGASLLMSTIRQLPDILDNAIPQPDVNISYGKYDMT